MRTKLMGTVAVLAILASAPAWADMQAATNFLDTEIGELSSLSRADQEKEMQWFIDAAKPMAGMDIKVVSETLGHASIRVTADVYAHLLEPQRRTAADAMTSVLWGAR